MKTNHLKNCKYIEIKDILGGEEDKGGVIHFISIFYSSGKISL